MAYSGWMARQTLYQPVQPFSNYVSNQSQSIGSDWTFESVVSAPAEFPPPILPQSQDEVKCTQQTPQSPHSHADGLALAQRDPKTSLPSKSMSQGHYVAVLPRRDANARKKTKRTDIPAGRNLQNLDAMISETTDETLVLELKQHKRLLRNRGAALASRQRKKKYTEDLEKKEKLHVQQISALEKEVDNLHLELSRREQRANGEIESLKDEIRSLKLDCQAEVTIPTCPDADVLLWGMPMAPNSVDTSQDTDASFASGLLFALLLCGAVATSQWSREPVEMPHMPVEVCTATLEVLDSLLSRADGTVDGQQMMQLHPLAVDSVQPISGPTSPPTPTTPGRTLGQFLANLQRQISMHSASLPWEKISLDVVRKCRDLVRGQHAQYALDLRW
ncbi:hypothetical protein K470DRAFT_162880 [Piedraia hortae CBS 480.64]|uniref:BZIP domain-containing protein n=1 Tax=Piedraia hortae CBS 480.64 TaxID=1314780 RepID=A0A6A7BQS0_9PEZI|nr:hypothetical protein K470DRAFT_162880 [Piedraia hortae CBS 480.64]